MASLQEILAKAGTLENAERMARFLSDDDPKYLLDLQLVLSAQGKFDEAWEISNKAIALFPEDHRVAFNRGWLCMRKGNFTEAFKLLDQGRFAGVWGDLPPQTSQPMWDGKEDLDGKTVLLYGEGGLGDEIICARFSKQLIDLGARAIIACSPSLVSLFSKIKGISAVINKVAVLAVYHDFWIPAMSAARLCNITQSTLSGKPYLSPHPEFLKRWKKKFQGFLSSSPRVFKVGIRWAGNPQFEHDQFRSFNAEKMIGLSSIPNTKFFSLQRDNDLHYLPENIVDLGSQLKTWEDTAAVINCLDLVISSCTSVAHLSGALGKPTWVIAPVMPYYTWAFPETASLWYDSVKLFRQKVFGNWEGLFKKVSFQLRKAVTNHIKTYQRIIR